MRLRLIADDLTGALDTAAQFVPLTGPVPVFWPGRIPDTAPPSAAIDSGTREQDAAEAAATAAGLAGILTPGPDVIAWFKLDSLLRGHPGRQLAATLRRAPVQRCIIAPAFPFQGRVTRGGLQYARSAEGWRQVGEDLAATLAAQGLEIHPARPGDAVPDGISLWDAETDDDLRRIAEGGRALGATVLWCGSGGLAGALAGSPDAVPDLIFPKPVLGLFGTDHPVTAAQLRGCGRHVLTLPDGGPESAAVLAGRLDQAGVALVAFDLPPGLSRPEAAERIDREMGGLARRIPPPGSLIVAGGETLRALCVSLKTGHLDLLGQLMPGVPCSVMRGGHWDGVPVISKSGAFGEPGLLRELIAPQTPQGRGKPT